MRRLPTRRRRHLKNLSKSSSRESSITNDSFVASASRTRTRGILDNFATVVPLHLAPARTRILSVLNNQSAIVVVVLIVVISLVNHSYAKLHGLADMSTTIDDDFEGVSFQRTVEPQVLQRLESHFLKLFQMEKRPVRTKGGALKVPKYLIDMYEAQSGLAFPTSNLNLPGRHTRTANTVRTFYDTDGGGQNQENSLHQHLRLHFDLTSIPAIEEVTGAELRVPFHINAGGSGEAAVVVSSKFPNKVRIVVSDISKKIQKKSHDSDPAEQIMYAVDSKVLDLNKKRKSEEDDIVWLTFDVFPAVARWLRLSKRNHGLFVQIFDVKTGQLLSQVSTTRNEEKHLRFKRDSVTVVSGSESRSPSSSQVPVLFTYSDDGVHKRKTRDAKTLSRHYRNALNQNRNRNNNKNNRNNRNRNKQRKKKGGQKPSLCARHKMHVDFADVGWNDWILAPTGYEAYTCKGECPFPMADHLNGTNHAVIQALVNSLNGRVPSPCCVPNQYSAKTIVYTDSSDKIVYKNYDEMVVESCGCS